MKKLILIVLITAVIISGILIFKNVTRDKFDYKIETISEYRYYIYKENEQFGVIDTEGKTIIKAGYTRVVIPNPRKRCIYLL